MASRRLPQPAGTWIDRSHPLSFTFNGRRLSGFRGDTLASALLANGVRLVGRSFKLPRPRGVWSCGVEEPSALVDIGQRARPTPNARATLLPRAAALAASARQVGVRIQLRTSAFGVYDHNLVCAAESVRAEGAADLPGCVLRERLWKIRARAVIVATGALERPLLFPDNDRPGVMLASAAHKYAQAFAVACGRRAVIAANCDYAYRLAASLAAAGVQILAVVDRREGAAPIAGAAGLRVLTGAPPTPVHGARSGAGCPVR